MKEKWTVAYVTYDSIEAEMIKDLLESGGIDSVIRSDKVTPFPVNVGKMGEVKIVVREEDKDAAVEMIEQFRQQNSNG
jgi:Putative prokaryotic signal transducing protein